MNVGLEGCVRQVWGRGCIGYGKVDFRLAPLEGELHFAGRSRWVLIDGIRMEVGMIVFALVVEGLDIEVCGDGARDGGGRL